MIETSRKICFIISESDGGEFDSPSHFGLKERRCINMSDINLRVDVDNNAKSGEQEILVTGIVMGKSCRISFSNKAIALLMGIAVTKFIGGKVTSKVGGILTVLDNMGTVRSDL